MSQKTIDRLIVNSPYEEPAKCWSYDRDRRTFSLMEGRRPAGYIVASEGSRSFDDRGSLSRFRWSTGFDRGSRRGARQGIRV